MVIERNFSISANIRAIFPIERFDNFYLIFGIGCASKTRGSRAADKSDNFRTLWRNTRRRNLINLWLNKKPRRWWYRTNSRELYSIVLWSLFRFFIILLANDAQSLDESDLALDSGVKRFSPRYLNAFKTNGLGLVSAVKKAVKRIYWKVLKFIIARRYVS